MLVASTPETTNPVADQCEANGVPCISSVAPWQPYFLGRQAPNRRQPEASRSTWTYHFFWGLEDIIAVFLDMWGQVDDQQDRRRPVARTTATGMPGAIRRSASRRPLKDAGYTIDRPGALREPHRDDFSAQIGTFKKEAWRSSPACPIPPDFTTFWTQAAQQGFKPKVASIGKALLFPSIGRGPRPGPRRRPLDRGLVEPEPPVQVVADGAIGQGAGRLVHVATPASSGPSRSASPTPSSRSRPTPSSGRRTSTTRRRSATRSRRPSLDTIVGHDRLDGPVSRRSATNVAKTPLVGGQWVKGTTFPYDLVIVSNKDHPDIPTAGTMQPIGG